MPTLLHSPPILSALVASNSTSAAQCRLSDRSQAAVTMYTAIATTIISTFANSYEECFYVAVLSWVPFTRASVGVFLNTVKMMRYIQSPGRADSQSVSWLQHFKWWWGHAYYPVAQTFWFLRNFETSTPLNLAARGTAVGAQLVALSFDPKARAIRAVGGRNFRGCSVIVRLMSFLSLLSRIALTYMMFREYVAAVLLFSPRIRTIVLAVCVPSSVVLCFLSYVFLVPDDDDVDPDDPKSDLKISNTRLLVGILLAASAGGFPFLVFLMSTNKNGLTVPDYVKCSSVNTWEKIQGIVF